MALASADLALHPKLTGRSVADAEPILPHSERSFAERVRAPDSYGLLLVLILGSIIASAAVSGTTFGRILSLVLLGGMLLFAMWTSRAGPHLRRIALVLVPTLVVVAAVLGLVSDSDPAHAVASAVDALLVFAALMAVLGRLKTHTTISFQTVLGALSIYLLLGLLFATIFSLTGSASGDPFFAQGASSGTSVNYVYFSYVTISTVGYGDLSAAGNLGKMLAASEALIGQLFLVTVVALFVSNLGKPTRRPRDEASPDGGAEERASD